MEWWGGPTIVVHGQAFTVAELPGFVAIEGSERIGLLTYRVERKWCEVMSLNSLRENIGIGTALLDAVQQAAQKAGCTSLTLITTNDNLHALGFYQRRGWRIKAVFAGAVDRARETLKPQISLIGENGIPIHDEIELEMPLDS